MAELFDVVFGEAGAFDRQSGDGLILVGANGKDRSDRAVRTACHLGVTFGYPIRVQTILDMEASGTTAKSSLGRLREAVEAFGHEKAPAGVGASHMPDHFDDEEYGRAQQLLAEAARSNAVLIVLGTHQGIKPFTGTMTEKLLREGGCPVLIAVNPEPGPYNKVLVAVDFSIFSDLAIDTISRWAPDAEVHLVHAYDPLLRRFQSGLGRREGMSATSNRLEETIRQQMDRLSGRPGGNHRFVAHVAAGNPKDVIRQKVDEINPDLFVIGTHGRTGVARAVLGSVATPFIDHPPCDLIVVKAW